MLKDWLPGEAMYISRWILAKYVKGNLYIFSKINEIETPKRVCTCAAPVHRIEPYSSMGQVRSQLEISWHS